MNTSGLGAWPPAGLLRDEKQVALRTAKRFRGQRPALKLNTVCVGRGNILNTRSGDGATMYLI